ncbi:hypothetical protein BCR37DRAFT_173891 [Protomyces lactucae-debilis]|uniref:Uncharacterized protein n=1 Tax=Protomyces lactucae-debilis TaxID=2754530 RepID=A0A1Y2EV06_PROLT|nr:uncharacterized protein BCR37DRAFT_173891 [Protomyces lactucae-debilis]ORY75400.1 hypothetical protein BCR37DRAFT_173891 [Protomyces lactucae-debilis]
MRGSKYVYLSTERQTFTLTLTAYFGGAIAPATGFTFGVELHVKTSRQIAYTPRCRTTSTTASSDDTQRPTQGMNLSCARMKHELGAVQEGYDNVNAYCNMKSTLGA